MPYESKENLPEDIKQKLPDGAQQIFMAAFNSATSDGMSEEAARRVAWNSVKNSYEEGGDGQWHHKPEGGIGTSMKGTATGA